MTPEILHDASRQRFLTIVDGHEGYVQYELAGDVMAIVHTIVPAAIGGRGIASDLVQHAFDGGGCAAIDRGRCGRGCVRPVHRLKPAGGQKQQGNCEKTG